LDGVVAAPSVFAVAVFCCNMYFFHILQLFSPKAAGRPQEGRRKVVGRP